MRKSSNELPIIEDVKQNLEFRRGTHHFKYREAKSTGSYRKWTCVPNARKWETFFNREELK